MSLSDADMDKIFVEDSNKLTFPASEVLYKILTLCSRYPCYKYFTQATFLPSARPADDENCFSQRSAAAGG